MKITDIISEQTNEGVLDWLKFGGKTTGKEMTAAEKLAAREAALREKELAAREAELKRREKELRKSRTGSSIPGVGAAKLTTSVAVKSVNLAIRYLVVLPEVLQPITNFINADAMFKRQLDNHENGMTQEQFTANRQHLLAELVGNLAAGMASRGLLKGALRQFGLGFIPRAVPDYIGSRIANSDGVRDVVAGWCGTYADMKVGGELNRNPAFWDTVTKFGEWYALQVDKLADNNQAMLDPLPGQVLSWISSQKEAAKSSTPEPVPVPVPKSQSNSSSSSSSSDEKSDAGHMEFHGWDKK